MLGTTLGQYRIMGTIGLGGMGAVYSAEHTLLGRAAAVKVLLPEWSRNQEIVTRFFNEARAAAAIRHPSIVEIYDFGWHTDGSAYLVMEHLQGESLASRLERGRISATGVMVIVRQIAGALTAAHKKGIIHRDLKPDNVFLVPDPEVGGGERIKLLDFGIAKLVADSDEHRMTRPGAILGTATYMAPEQCRGAVVDHRADLYSLGCIMFEMFTGRPPFVGEGVGDLLAAHVYLPPPTVSSLVTDVPLEFEQLVQHLLVKDLQQRMQSAEAVVQAIDFTTGSAYRTGHVVIAGPGLTTQHQPLPVTLAVVAGATAPRAPIAHRRRMAFVGLGIVSAIGAMLAVMTIAAATHRRDRDPMPLDVVSEPVPKPPSPMPAPAIRQHTSAPVETTTRENLSTPPFDADRAAAFKPSVSEVPSATRMQVPAGVSGKRIAQLHVQLPVEPPEPSLRLDEGDGAVSSSESTPSAPSDPVLRVEERGGAIRSSESASSELPTTEPSVAQLYAGVGQQLKVFAQEHGSQASDLWAQFTLIRINEAISDPLKRVEAESLLHRLLDQIVERSR